ncbi:MAG: beta-ketoacyl-ACP synthase III [Candidatus Kapaibacterium sp.]
MTATITSIAHYVPPDVYPNSYFEEYLDTNDEWIIARTGIKERHILKNGATSDLIVPAAEECIKKRGISKDDIDCIIVATVTPDHMFPNTASVVQRKLGLKNAWGFDSSAACSGFLVAMMSAAAYINSGLAKKVLLCGGDKMSAITNFQDRTQAVLFGDAAGVCLIEKSDDPEYGIIDNIFHMEGEGGKYLYQLSGGSYKPASHETVDNNEHYLYQDGQNVFKSAVKGMADVSVEIMEKNNLTHEDIAWLVPHQANMRIITATAKRMNLEPEKVMINIDKYGNTTAATIPMCISEWYQAGKVIKGDRLVLSSFGAGFMWGSV